MVFGVVITMFIDSIQISMFKKLRYTEFINSFFSLSAAKIVDFIIKSKYVKYLSTPLFQYTYGRDTKTYQK